MKSTVDLADLVGLHLVMSKNAGKGEYKIMVAAMGWSTAELLTSRCIPLWVGARGIEFDWKYIQMSFDSNLSLVSVPPSPSPTGWMGRRACLRAVLTRCLSLSLCRCLVSVLLLGSWTALMVNTATTAAVSLSTLILYINLVHGN
ncbi:transmembrane protein 147 [Chiloscyllium plagiosum]|uniref:transmembrane protein 147 n=1 Tax=Chiloscyllium plagiosum TaxID=36176 RepID=UPI001CB7F184|nr:transmembrane protein 147 [Chiloscyllium plagiosum]